MSEPLFTLDTAAGNGLTDRQAHGLEIIRRHQPIRSDQLGAHLHAYRQANGGKGHSADAFCDWCTSEGRSVAKALQKKGLARYVRRKGWVTADEQAPIDRRSAQLGLDDPWPEGF